jgi:hypothetical protein
MWKVNARLLDRPIKGAEEKFGFLVGFSVYHSFGCWWICVNHFGAYADCTVKGELFFWETDE